MIFRPKQLYFNLTIHSLSNQSWQIDGKNICSGAYHFMGIFLNKELRKFLGHSLCSELLEAN